MRAGSAFSRYREWRFHASAERRFSNHSLSGESVRTFCSATTRCLFVPELSPHKSLSLFALLSLTEFKGSHAYFRAFLATIVMGALVELAEGVSGQGHCRMRDMLPNTAGAILGLLIFGIGRRA